MRQAYGATIHCALSLSLLLVFISSPLLDKASAQDENLLKNPSFEESSLGPTGWTIEKKRAAKGRIEIVNQAHSGRNALKLSPNNQNTSIDVAKDPLGIAQGLPAQQFSGKQLYVSGWLGAEGEARAIIMLILLRPGLPEEVHVEVAATQGYVYRESVLAVPKNEKLTAIVLLCMVGGTSGAAYFDDLRLSTIAPPSDGSKKDGSSATGTTQKILPPSNPAAAAITVDAGREIRRIPANLYGANTEWIWNSNGMWDEGRNAFNPQIIQMSKTAGISLIRFPGGILSDFYSWRDGVGPRANRRETEHSPRGPYSRHNVGTDEILNFAQQTGAKLLLTANIVTGTPEEAADWVKYVDGKGQGQLVEYWELGNESYIKDNSPHNRPATMTPSQYIKKYQEFARAMRGADPKIKLAAISDANFHYTGTGYPGWTDEILRAIGTDVDFLAVHNAYAPLMWEDKGWDVRTVYRALLAAPVLIEKSFDELNDSIRANAPQRASHIQLLVTEWGTYYSNVDPRGRWVDHGKTLGSALFDASTLNVFLRTPNVAAATFYQLFDQLSMGMIGMREGQFTPKPSYYVFEMYTHHFGDRLIASSTESPTFDSFTSIGRVGAVRNVPYLDVVASLSADRKMLYLMVVNKQFDEQIPAKAKLNGCEPKGNATVWTLDGTAIDANTGTELFQGAGVRWASEASESRFDKGGPNEISLHSTILNIAAPIFEYTFPPHSLTSLEIPCQ